MGVGLVQRGLLRCRRGSRSARSGDRRHPHRAWRLMGKRRSGHAAVRVPPQGAAGHLRLQHRVQDRLRVVALGLGLLLATSAPALAQGPAPPPAEPTIITTGEAIVRRVPDVAYVTLAVESRARNPRDAQKENADAMAAVQRQLAAAGIPKDALRTLGLWLQQEFDTANGRRVSRGFLARNTLEVRIDDVARAGELADTVVQGGATSLDGIRFDLKDRAAAEREALRLAVADARGRADAAASGAGRTVDRVLKIDDSRQGGRVARPVQVMRAEAGAATSVEPGVLGIRARVALAGWTGGR